MPKSEDARCYLMHIPSRERAEQKGKEYASTYPAAFHSLLTDAFRNGFCAGVNQYAEDREMDRCSRSDPLEEMSRPQQLDPGLLIIDAAAFNEPMACIIKTS